MTAAKTYSGGCHCGKVRFEATTDLASTITCNCSICSKRGWILTFVGDEQFKLLSGHDVLKDYQFGKKHIHHRFCSVCGTQSFGQGAGPGGKPTYAVNVLCLDGVDPKSLTPHAHDGASM
jgi:hypothetical protein